jgi:hypothetical protein
MPTEKIKPVVVIKRGVSVLHVVGAVLLTLKITGVLPWHWMIVLLPFYLMPASILIATSLAFFYGLWVYLKVKGDDPK